MATQCPQTEEYCLSWAFKLTWQTVASALSCRAPAFTNAAFLAGPYIFWSTTPSLLPCLSCQHLFILWCPSSFGFHQSQGAIYLFYIILCLISVCGGTRYNHGVYMYVVELSLRFYCYMCSRDRSWATGFRWPTPSPYETLPQPRKSPLGAFHSFWCTEIVQIAFLCVVLILLVIKNGMELPNRVAHIKVWHRIGDTGKICWFQ